MKKILAAILIFPFTVYAQQWDFDNSGSRIFDMRKNEHSKITITIESVDPKDMQKACDKKSRQVGNDGFQTPMLACSFWQGKKCHIILPHKVDMRTVGHEVMHCFQGSWH